MTTINLKSLENKAFQKSKDYSDSEYPNYAYAMGYFYSDVSNLLECLNLNKKQMKQFEKYIQENGVTNV